MDNNTYINIVNKALLIRRVEERLLELFAEGKLHGTVHTCIGQEFSAAVLSEFLDENDAVITNHRCHGHYLSMFGDVDGLISELLGKSTGVCGGRGGSQHLCRGNFYSNGIQGGGVPIAAGLAYARKLRGDKSIAVSFVGDGTLGEGTLYETLNIVSIYSLPLLIILENNGVAQSTDTSTTTAGTIAGRASAFDIEYATASTYEWSTLYKICNKAVDYVRAQGKPFVLEIETFRLKAHSKGDDLRPRNLVEVAESKDPLNLLIASGDKIVSRLDEVIKQKIEVAVEAAIRAPVQPLVHKAHSAGCYEKITWISHDVGSGKYGKALRDALFGIMKEDETVLMIGEDLRDPYGGAFKITHGLSTQYSDRVINTPISEASIVGIGIGLALEGRRPFVEIMFGDFLGLAFDQIVNHAAKFRYMYNEQVSPRVVVRTPMGGYRGYGPTHSQTLDRHFLGVPGLKVIALNILINPTECLKSLSLYKDGPVLMIENKVLYTREMSGLIPEGWHCARSDEKFPVVWVNPDASSVDLTIVTYGGMTTLALEVLEELFVEHDIIAQLLIPTEIYPFRIEVYMSAINKTRSILFIEEGQAYAGFSSEMISQLAIMNKSGDKVKYHILAAESCGIPSGAALEVGVLPSKKNLIDAAIDLTA